MRGGDKDAARNPSPIVGESPVECRERRGIFGKDALLGANLTPTGL